MLTVSLLLIGFTSASTLESQSIPSRLRPDSPFSSLEVEESLKPGHRLEDERFVLLYRPFRLAVRAESFFHAKQAVRSTYNSLLSQVLNPKPSVHVSEATNELFFVFRFAFDAASAVKQPSAFSRIIESLAALHDAQIDAFPQAVPHGFMNFVSSAPTAQLSSIEVAEEFTTLCERFVGPDALCDVPPALVRLLERLFTREPQEMFCRFVQTRHINFQSLCGEEVFVPALDQLAQHALYIDVSDVSRSSAPSASGQLGQALREYKHPASAVFGRMAEVHREGSYAVFKLETALIAVVGPRTRDAAVQVLRQTLPGLGSLVTMVLAVEGYAGLYLFAPSPKKLTKGNAAAVVQDAVRVYAATRDGSMRGVSLFPGLEKLELMDGWLLRDGPLKDVHLGGRAGSMMLDALQICVGSPQTDLTAVADLANETLSMLEQGAEISVHRDFCHLVDVLDLDAKFASSGQRGLCWQESLRPSFVRASTCDSFPLRFRVDPTRTMTAASPARSSSPRPQSPLAALASSPRGTSPLTLAGLGSPRLTQNARSSLARMTRGMSGLADETRHMFSDVTLLGVGQYGCVYRANMRTVVTREGEVIRDENSQVAVKLSNGFMTSVGLSQPPSAVNPFETELLAMDAVKDVLDFIPRSLGTINGYAGYLMTFFEGKSLLTGVQCGEDPEGFCTTEDIEAVTEKLARNALQLWRSNIVHGDLHGGNIMVNRAREVVFIDLGRMEMIDGKLIDTTRRNPYHEDLEQEVDNFVNSFEDARFLVQGEDGEADFANVRPYVEQLRKLINAEYPGLAVVSKSKFDD